MLKATILTQIAEARRKRNGWTAWRPFLSDRERGDSKCSVHPERIGAEVSYCTSESVRIVRCHGCTQHRRGERFSKDQYTKEDFK